MRIWLAFARHEQLARGNYCIYGSGKYAKALLARIEEAHLKTPRFILDDNPTESLLNGIDVRSVAAAELNEMCSAILLGSDTFATSMRERLQEQGVDDASIVAISTMTVPSHVSRVSIDGDISAFEYEDNMVLRRISPKRWDRFQGIWDRVTRSGADHFLPPTAMVSDQPFTVAQERVSFVTYPSEWSSLMLRDAALTQLDIFEAMHDAKLGLKDGHPHNLCFDKGRFRFLDLTSILDEPTPGKAFEEFVECFVHPLLLCSKGGFARSAYLLSYPDGTRFEDIAGYLGPDEKRDYGELIAGMRSALECGDVQGTISLVRGYVAGIKVVQQKSRWTHYHGAFSEPTDGAPDTKQRKVLQLVNEIAPASLIDIAGNSGWYSHSLAEQGVRSLCVDNDPESINLAYSRVSGKDRGLDFTPAVCDFITPMPAKRRMFCSEHIKPILPSAFDRMRCECALMLAAVHHLVFSQGLTFKEIVAQLSEFCTSHAIVEFCAPEGDPHSKDWYRPTSWYTLDEFQKALSVHFRSQKTFSSGSNCRTLIVCKR